ncbi:MAG: pyruvate dehydrogenase complex dihydrolipoamide acetyltransferase [Proteobacteria bacterium]|nr:pyruvate dehydrogenase complex dihydrolipoamide acetyltransferase [Pseudomonadota bacterium]
MPIEILMPALSPTMTEGNLAKWTKKEGDVIKAGQVIAEIETDKATMEVEAVDEGVLGKILVPAGTANVPVNKLIALLLKEGEDKKALDSYKPKQAEAPKAVAPAASGSAPAAPTAAAPAAPKLAPAAATMAPAAPKAAATSSGGRTKASPLAKRAAAEFGIDISQLIGTGPHGRVIRADVEDARRGGGARGGIARRHPVEFVQIPHSNMRKTIARRLTESKQTIPHFYLTLDVVLDKLMEVRAALNGDAVAAAGKEGKPAFKLSVNDFVIKAVGAAMKKMPNVNVSWYDDAMVQYNNVDVSVAVATPTGLITPIIRNADQKSIAQISNEMKDLAGRARDNKLKPEEYTGGGFSVSNLGMYGIKQFEAIINPPQACILAVGAGEERAIVKNGQLVPATVMSATLSVDHRAVDGALGAEFLSLFKRYIEEPVLLFV